VEQFPQWMSSQATQPVRDVFWKLDWAPFPIMQVSQPVELVVLHPKVVLEMQVLFLELRK